MMHHCIDIDCCRLQIMVAEPSSRRKGLAFAALSIFMAYTVQTLVSLAICLHQGCSCTNHLSRRIF